MGRSESTRGVGRPHLGVPRDEWLAWSKGKHQLWSQTPVGVRTVQSMVGQVLHGSRGFFRVSFVSMVALELLRGHIAHLEERVLESWLCFY